MHENVTITDALLIINLIANRLGEWNGKRGVSDYSWDKYLTNHIDIANAFDIFLTLEEI